MSDQMTRCVLDSSGIVVNVIELEAGREHDPGPGLLVVAASPEVGVGWRLEAGEWQPPPPPAPSADDVRAEAARRMMALLGARDASHLGVLIANGTREAVRLLRKGTSAWTGEEASRAAQLEQIDAAIEAIRAASNAMESSPPPDYAADHHWS